MTAPRHPALEDANQIASDLAYWVGHADSAATLRILEGFGVALALSVAMRAEGQNAPAMAFALAEVADQLRQLKDARHAGWLLLSVSVELKHLAAYDATIESAQGTAAELSEEVAEIAKLLVRRGTEALACGAS